MSGAESKFIKNSIAVYSEKKDLLSESENSSDLNSELTLVEENDTEIADQSIISNTEVPTAWISHTELEKSIQKKSALKASSNSSTDEELQELLDIDLKQQDVEVHSLPVTSRPPEERVSGKLQVRKIAIYNVKLNFN